MDGFTAKVLLEAAQNNIANGKSNDGIIDFAKALNKDAPNPPTQEVIDLVTSWIGKPCKVKYTTHRGVVHGVNRSAHGFYPGGRSPVYVKVTESTEPDSIGTIFEYGLDQVEVTE